MPYKNEMMLMGMDASADTSTQLCFDPPEGPFGPDNVVTGEITHTNDEDWIAIKLTEGNTYTITTGGGTGDELNDSVLKLMSSKGGLIAMNDDKDPTDGDLSSELEFTPEVGSGTQVYFISVSGYTGNPGANNTGSYTVSVAQAAVLPPGESADIEGTENADKLAGTGDSESIAGLAGDDTLYGGAGDDMLFGGDGADLLVGGAGADTLEGGSSTYDHDGDGENDDGSPNADASPEIEHLDTISYSYSPAGVSINLTSGAASGGDAEGDTLGDDIENVIGSAHDDVLTGTDDVNVGNSLWGLAGNDVLSGREGEDMLYGGAGDDSLSGGDEDDTLEGGPGADELTGGLGNDTASYAGSGMGVTVRLHSSQAMGGDAEGDTWGDTVTVEYTEPAEDPDDPPVDMEETVPDIVNLTGSHLADVLAGDSRDNTISGNGGDDKIYGGPGGGDDMLHGGRGDDMVFGGRGDDTLSGGMGDDMLHGGAGADDFFGGSGNDMIYADLDDDVIDGGENPPGHRGDMDTVSFERLVDEGVGAEGDTDGDTNAFLLGGPNVEYNPEEGEYGIFDRTNPEAITFAADETGIDAVNIERVIGSEDADFITGAAHVGTPGSAGYMTSPEEIEGGDGGDTLIGGDGPGDTVSYESSDRRVRVELGDGSDGADGSSNSGGHANGDTISGFENIKGSAYGDVLTALDGTAGATGSTLWGLGGDDNLFGGLGNDTIEGGAGADEMNGGTHADRGDDDANNQTNTLSYAGSDAGVTVNLATSTASGGHAEGDEIETYELKINVGEDDEDEIDVSTFVNVTGSMHNDYLTGDMFGNHLAGAAGDDSLRGGAGADVLIGGPGADRLDGGKSTLAEEDDGNTADIDESQTQHEDWAAYRSAQVKGVTVNLNTGMGTAGDAMGDTLKNIELIWGSKQDDVFIASEGTDIIHGDGGSDTISYEASKHGVNVNLAGTTPVNTATGDNATWTAATADDEAVFNAATDALVGSWMPGAATPAVRPTAVEAFNTTATDKSYAKGDILASIENVTGSRQDDTITGGAVPNVLKGGGGNDTLNGGAQDDKLYGEAGRDTLNGGTEDDMLNGGAGNDTLNGEAGEDTLVGGAGDDDLSGGGGTDTFVFGPGNGHDVISDSDTTPNTVETFISNQGRIDLSAFGIKAGDLAGLISTRAGNTVIDLSDYGGGSITIQAIDDLDVFDTDATGGTGNDGDDDEILSVSIRNDINGDGDVEDNIDGVQESDGIFIL